MATGRKTDFSGSSVKDSDFLFDFTCTPCAKEGLNNEAINYCVECSEYFCEACTKHHKKFGATSDHNVVNRTLTKRPGGVPPSPVVRETCREHHGERLTTYCADHDLVVCNTCVAVDHRLCDGISYIPKAAGGAKQSKDINKVKKQISESLKTNDQTKVALQRSLTSADQEKTDHHKRINDYTERLITHTRDLQKEAIGDVDSHHKTTTETLKSDIRSIDDASTIMKTRLASLNNVKANSEAQVFVDLKRGSQEVETARQLQQDVAPSTTGKTIPEFVVNKDVENFLSEVRSLGQPIENKALRAVFLGGYSVKMEDDEKMGGITDSCELHDGDILIADTLNNALKKLDRSSYSVKECLIMPSGPSCICQTEKFEVAVTLFRQKKVQFVDVTGRLRLTRSFQVGDRCRGVVYSKNELFVVCGGYPGDKDFEPEGPAFVSVFNKSGSPLRTFNFDHRGRNIISWPRRIAASANGNNLYISGGEGGIIITDRSGHMLSTVSSDALQGAFGVCTFKGDTILVCGHTSNNVVQIGQSGKMVAELLTENNDIKNPVSIRPIRDYSRLILTGDKSSTITVFSLRP